MADPDCDQPDYETFEMRFPLRILLHTGSHWQLSLGQGRPARRAKRVPKPLLLEKASASLQAGEEHLE